MMRKRIFEQFYFLVQDLKRWNVKSLKEFFYFIFELGVWATINYRIRRILFLIDIPILKIIIRLFTFFIGKISEIITGIIVHSETEIGPGLYIGHSGSLVIHPKVRIGKNFSIGNSVTLGERGEGYEGVPVIGDGVFVHTGAKVLGNIKIGNNVKIGANAVVLTDIPDNTTAVGVPAKVIKVNPSKGS